MEGQFVAKLVLILYILLFCFETIFSSSKTRSIIVEFFFIRRVLRPSYNGPYDHGVQRMMISSILKPRSRTVWLEIPECRA